MVHSLGMGNELCLVLLMRYNMTVEDHVYVIKNVGVCGRGQLCVEGGELVVQEMGGGYKHMNTYRFVL